MSLYFEPSKEETILDYYLRRAREVRMLYYKTGNKKYASMASRLASEGRKEFERTMKNETLRN